MMNTLEQAQRSRRWDVTALMRHWIGMASTGIGDALRAIALLTAELETAECRLAFDERLRRTGRVRYR